MRERYVLILVSLNPDKTDVSGIEFPDFGYVEAKLLVICHKYGVTKQEFIHWAEEQSRKWEHPYQSPPYWGFLCEQIMWADIEPFPEVLEDYYTSKEFEKLI